MFLNFSLVVCHIVRLYIYIEICPYYMWLFVRFLIKKNDLGFQRKGPVCSASATYYFFFNPLRSPIQPYWTWRFV